MKNVAIAVKGNELIIKVDLSENQGLSNSGKTTIIASTEGNPLIEGTDNIYIGLYVYRKAKK